jgi:hypothetical protein
VTKSKETGQSILGSVVYINEDEMAANPFTRGTSPGRARPPHRGSFKRDHAKHGGRQKGTPNAISARARKAIAAAAKRIPRGTTLNRNHWQWVIEKNPLINEAREHQGQSTLTGAPRVRSRKFNMKAFNKDLSAVAMHAIQTDQFVHRELVECLTLLGVRDRSEFAKFLTIAAPKQSYLAARPHAEVVEPREAINPGVYRHPPIPEWTLGYDPTLAAYTPVPVDPALPPEDAQHEICGAPFNAAPGWDWKFDSEARRFRPIALRPKTPIPEWTLRFDPKLGQMTPIPVDRRLSPDEAYHREYGSPLFPATGWKWDFDPWKFDFDSRAQRLLPSIADGPSRPVEPRFALPKVRRLYRWHPDEGHYSLVRDDDDDWEEYEDNLYEYDCERLLFKRYQPLLDPLTPLKPRAKKIPLEPQTPPRRRFFVPCSDGSYAPIRSDQPIPDSAYGYDSTKNRFVPVDR